MNVSQRLTKLYQSAKEIWFNNFSKIILLSDCHRGDNSLADDFVHNKSVYLTALQYYYYKGFTYFELGDADELWEFKNFSSIYNAHREVFDWLVKFHRQNRYLMIWGNHDIYKKDPHFLLTRQCNISGAPLFDNLDAYESVILHDQNYGYKMLLLHGHQADPINDRYWRISCFLDRYLWRRLELLGVNDPISPAKNYRKKNIIEQRIVNWINENHLAVIAGHTHRPVFPKTDEPPYFNCGSCIYPDGITGIEIANGKIALVKWSARARVCNDQNSSVTRTLLAGPESLYVFSRREMKREA